MDQQKEPIVNEQVSREETPSYVPRPKWQLVLAWVLLILMLVGVAGYYYWIAFPQGF